MNTKTLARAQALCLAGLVVVGCLILLRIGGSDEPAARPRRTATTTVPMPISTTPASTPAPAGASTTGAPVPTGPTAEAAHPPVTPAPTAADDAARVARGFLHAWVLRADVDARGDELKKWAVPDYAALTATVADPNLLPPGDQIEVTSTDVRGDLGATVVARVDGIAVRVDLVRTARGYLVNGHAPA